MPTRLVGSPGKARRLRRLEERLRLAHGVVRQGRLAHPRHGAQLVTTGRREGAIELELERLVLRVEDARTLESEHDLIDLPGTRRGGGDGAEGHELRARVGLARERALAHAERIDEALLRLEELRHLLGDARVREPGRGRRSRGVSRWKHRG